MRNKIQNEMLFNENKSFRKAPCIISKFEINIYESGKIDVSLNCNYGPYSIWQIPGEFISHIMIMFKVREWSILNNKYCYLLFDKDHSFRGLAQLEPDGYTHLFFTKEKLKKGFLIKWWKTDYPNSKIFKLLLKYTEK